VEAILTRAKERAVLASRDDDVQKADVEEAVHSFIDPLDPNLLALQELAAVLACSDRRYLPDTATGPPTARNFSRTSRASRAGAGCQPDPANSDLMDAEPILNPVAPLDATVVLRAGRQTRVVHTVTASPAAIGLLWRI
jgi:hypothetical protein